ncbi:MAG: ankyrin repeat domain-containing protein [Longimicrobiales bacterium]|nr:ankyrin repeat domain-containing protein [Longimicrobiales bacterium]
MKIINRGLRVEVFGSVVLALLLLRLSAVESPIADAAMNEDFDSVQFLIQEGEEVNAAQGDGMTALHWAAENGDVEMLEMLMSAGANPEAVTRLGRYTPLHLASKLGREASVVSLLRLGSAVNPRTTTGAVTPLHFAAASGSELAVKALLDHGANVDAKELQWDQTPLMFAAALNRVGIIDILVAHGADISMAAKVIDIAKRQQEDRADQAQWNNLRRVLAGSPVRNTESKPSNAETQPVPEVQLRAVDEIDPLSYADLVGTHGGLTPLLLSVREGHFEAVRNLLDNGADINQTSAGDQTSSILLAAINGHFDLVKQLLEWGADPNIASDAGGTPLYAVLNMEWAPKARHPQPVDYMQQQIGYLELMEVLLESGVDPNVRLKKNLWYTTYARDLLGVDRSGATPFWRAAHATDVAAMELLVRYGADPTIATRKTPDRRRRRGEQEDFSGLSPVPVGGRAVAPIVAAAGVGYGQGFAGNSHRHVPDGWIPAVQYLVEEHGADVNDRDHNGYSPVHHAAARGDNELILYLVSLGADVTLVSRTGQTTVDLANGPVQRIQPFPETIALLESLGAINNHNCLTC